MRLADKTVSMQQHWPLNLTQKSCFDVIQVVLCFDKFVYMVQQSV